MSKPESQMVTITNLQLFIDKLNVGRRKRGEEIILLVKDFRSEEAHNNDVVSEFVKSQIMDVFDVSCAVQLRRAQCQGHREGNEDIPGYSAENRDNQQFADTLRRQIDLLGGLGDDIEADQHGGHHNQHHHNAGGGFYNQGFGVFPLAV